jgi:hypothetical protein
MRSKYKIGEYIFFDHPTVAGSREVESVKAYSRIIEEKYFDKGVPKKDLDSLARAKSQIIHESLLTFHEKEYVLKNSREVDLT